MPCDAVPRTGAVVGVVKTKEPATLTVVPATMALAELLDKLELAKVCPYVIAVAIAEIVGVALFTVTLAVVVTTLYFVVSLGVKVTPCDEVPAFGAVVVAVKTKEPVTLAVPDKLEFAKVCPYVI